jgi:hypothetical protein
MYSKKLFSGSGLYKFWNFRSLSFTGKNIKLTLVKVPVWITTYFRHIIKLLYSIVDPAFGAFYLQNREEFFGDPQIRHIFL